MCVCSLAVHVMRLQGWMGDAGLSADTMTLNFDTPAFHMTYAQVRARVVVPRVCAPSCPLPHAHVAP